jgi:L-rhamnose isomerase
MDVSAVERAYDWSRERYAGQGVDTDSAVAALGKISISLPCWQGDDVRGFEKTKEPASAGGIQATGDHPGRAGTVDELRQDLKTALSLIPGQHRINLHAIYGEFGGRPVARDEIEPGHFRGWVDWAKAEKLKLDFNATCFSHPKAAQGFTLSSPDREIRRFWIGHVRCCRRIAAFLGRELKAAAIHNLWIPDGSKDLPFDRWTPRRILRESLDEIFKPEYSPAAMKDSLESKLFGIGSESYVVGSHEFYLAYALVKRKILCLDLGHFHPTESVADKLSALLEFFDELLLHLSRPVRWDSDHVVILDDEMRRLAEEVVRGRALERVHLAMDFFDASMNRVGAWVIGARAVLKAFLGALLQPQEGLRNAEEEGDYFRRLALMEDAKMLPAGAVWDWYCLEKDVPLDCAWHREIQRYERSVLSKRLRGPLTAAR